MIAVSPGLDLAIVVEKVEAGVIPGHGVGMASFSVLAVVGWHGDGIAPL